MRPSADWATTASFPLLRHQVHPQGLWTPPPWDPKQIYSSRYKLPSTMRTLIPTRVVGFFMPLLHLWTCLAILIMTVSYIVHSWVRLFIHDFPCALMYTVPSGMMTTSQKAESFKVLRDFILAWAAWLVCRRQPATSAGEDIESGNPRTTPLAILFYFKMFLNVYIHLHSQERKAWEKLFISVSSARTIKSMINDYSQGKGLGR